MCFYGLIISDTHKIAHRGETEETMLEWRKESLWQEIVENKA